MGTPEYLRDGFASLGVYNICAHHVGLFCTYVYQNTPNSKLMHIFLSAAAGLVTSLEFLLFMKLIVQMPMSS